MTCLVFITNSALFSLRHKHAQAHQHLAAHSTMPNVTAPGAAASAHGFPTFVMPAARLQGGSTSAVGEAGKDQNSDRFLFEWPPRQA